MTPCGVYEGGKKLGRQQITRAGAAYGFIAAISARVGGRDVVPARISYCIQQGGPTHEVPREF